MKGLPASNELSIATLRKTAQTRQELRRYFGKVLHELRESRNLSQAELAEKVFVEPLTIHRWETGKSLPYPHYRVRLCEIFEVEATVFFLSNEGIEQEDNPLQGTVLVDLSQTEEQALIEERRDLSRLKVQKKSIECAIEIARMVVDTLYPHLEQSARDATVGSLVQKLLLEPSKTTIHVFLEQYRPLHVNTRKTENG